MGAGGPGSRAPAVATSTASSLAGRPPLDALETRERYERITAATVQRLTGADSVEVIDADKPDDWQEEAAEPARYGRWLTDADKPDSDASRAKLKQIMASPDPMAAALRGGGVSARLAARYQGGHQVKPYR